MRGFTFSLSALCLALFASYTYATVFLINPDRVAKGITEKGLRKKLNKLWSIAQENGGNRAFGTPGFEASRDYVVSQVQKYSLTMDVSVQNFSSLYEETRSISLTEDGEDIKILTMLYNHPTPAEGVTAPLLVIPVDDVIGTGCTAEQWAGIDATGFIPLIKRGVCAGAAKLKLAKAAGAEAAIIYHNLPGEYGSLTLSPENVGLLIPSGIISNADGLEWTAAIEGGEEITVTLIVDSFWEDRQTWNVFAETKTGDPNNVVMLGAHLDSVKAGAGINDDGSGTAGLLEILDSMWHYRVKNKVRFAWWGAEENGLLGSEHYTASLPEEELNKIAIYNNFDMIGSLDPLYGVLKNADDGFVYSAQLLYDYLEDQGVDVYFGAFSGGSDYQPFLDLGIPASGIHTGTTPYDPCYHLACDTIDNINWDAITVNAQAAGFTTATLALDTEAPAESARRAAQAIRNDIHWEADHDHTGHTI